MIFFSLMSELLRLHCRCAGGVTWCDTALPSASSYTGQRTRSSVESTVRLGGVLAQHSHERETYSEVTRLKIMLDHHYNC